VRNRAVHSAHSMNILLDHDSLLMLPDSPLDGSSRWANIVVETKLIEKDYGCRRQSTSMLGDMHTC
jgi:hypothetical protein